MKKSDLSWLAGYLEGEGCFCISRNGNGRPKSQRITLSVHSVDQDVIEHASRIMDCTTRFCGITVTGKRVYEARINDGAHVVTLINQLLPLMGKRRSKKIKELLKFQKNRPGIAKGESCGQSKLTARRVVMLRRMAALNPPRGWQSKMAKRCGVSQASVWYAINGKTWCRV